MIHFLLKCITNMQASGDGGDKKPGEVPDSKEKSYSVALDSVIINHFPAIIVYYMVRKYNYINKNFIT